MPRRLRRLRFTSRNLSPIIRTSQDGYDDIGELKKVLLVRVLSIITVLLLSIPNLFAAEWVNRQLEQLLAAERAPDGVVFEVMAWQDHSWEWVVPMLQEYVERLHHKYPDLDVALVSQGAELFDLARRAGMEDSPTLLQLARLNAAGLEIHIDGEYARWKRLGTQDFLDFVDVAESGDAQLADYIKLGFAHVRLTPPDSVLDEVN